jgi:hypothetical protein
MALLEEHQITSVSWKDILLKAPRDADMAVYTLIKLLIFSKFPFTLYNQMSV